MPPCRLTLGRSDLWRVAKPYCRKRAPMFNRFVTAVLVVISVLVVVGCQASSTPTSTRALAASLEATRVAQIPTPEPASTPEPTPTPLPTATPHPSTYCREWEALVLEWVRDGNVYDRLSLRLATDSSVPDHPNLTASLADDLCITDFPWGRHGTVWLGLKVGTGEGQLLPGTYRYRSKTGDDRVSVRDCTLSRNFDQYYDAELAIELPYGEPFEFTFHTYHNVVWFGGCGGFLYRVGD